MSTPRRYGSFPSRRSCTSTTERPCCTCGTVCPSRRTSPRRWAAPASRSPTERGRAVLPGAPLLHRRAGNTVTLLAGADFFASGPLPLPRCAPPVSLAGGACLHRRLADVRIRRQDAECALLTV